LSLDYSDPDAAGEDSQFSVSNNSTRIGFKGEHDISEALTLLWQYEQGVDIDDGGGEFAKRNSFLGIKGRLGELRAGHHDTPSKSMGSRWGLFSDTNGDRRAILGAYSGSDPDPEIKYGNVLNDRADNAVLYLNDFSGLALQVMYSASNPSDDVSGGLDDNDSDLFSASLAYTTGPLTLLGAVETWSQDPVNGTEGVDNLRLGAIYTMERLRLGAIFESTDSDDDVYNRDAFGVNAAFGLSDAMDLRAQYLMADDYKGVSDSGASQLALGLFNQLDSATQIYAVFSMTDNDDNAKYQGIDGGHGDELETELGGTPSSLSVGAVYKF
ncbi:MAG: porin, partial [Gammaproteobacteria bacterium]|nr:porin [Gammaproteobacteria bacterium]